jgi:hypothetical protein
MSCGPSTARMLAQPVSRTPTKIAVTIVLNAFISGDYFGLWGWTVQLERISRIFVSLP